MVRAPGGAGAPQTAHKPMSSRLSNMKFMQRAAANTPLPPSPVQESDEPSAKRLKLSRSHSDSIRRPDTAAKLKSEENTLLGGNSAETKWTLLSDDDDSRTRKAPVEEATDDESLPWEVGGWGTGRMSFGKFKNKLKQSGPRETAPSRNEESVDESEQSDSDSANEDREESAGAKRFAEENLARVKAALADKRRAGREKSAGLSKQRKEKDVRLNRRGLGRIDKGAGRTISSGGNRH